MWWLEQDFVGPGRRRALATTGSSPRCAPSRTRPARCCHTSGRTAGRSRGGSRLLRATRTQLEPIFLLYDGAPPFDGPPARPADLEVGGTRLWRLEGDHGVAAAFADRQLLIADGHHRYETAVEFAAEDGADRMLVVLVSTDDPGLVIFPTHRVFAGRPDIDPAGEQCASVADAISALEWEPEAHAAAVLVRSDGARLLRGGEGRARRGARRPVRSRGDRVHPGPRGGGAPGRERGGRRGVPRAAAAGRPTSSRRRGRGGRLPQKATYFFPKLVSGLLFHPVDP